jgi:biofilm PGA synthesis N-glycosyltransferase PgaC
MTPNAADRGLRPFSLVQREDGMATISAGTRSDYIVVTPADNEAETILGVMECLAAQTILPDRWVVVDDASTDQTAKLVRAGKVHYAWVELICLQRDGERNFGGKARCFNAGVDHLRDLSYRYLANLDADVTFPPDYFAYLLACLEADPRLGVVGTPFREDRFAGYDYRFTNPEHVSGACQLFRRACLEEVGGYRIVPSGGIDWIASTTARMLGWKTMTCPDRHLMHHRRIGTGNRHWGNLQLRQGRKDYMLGNGIGWQLLRCLYQVRYPPYVVGALLMMVGYLQYALLRKPRPISDRLVQFVRKEHSARMRALARRMIRRNA